ncbi:MAG: serine--tRNA ligase, partial [Methylobacteriaceae bacterium]|nr:serine--tRNA ligase [Methylobacteriaceae bacterium]
MHDIRFIREHPDLFDRGLARRGLAPLSAELLQLDEDRRLAVAALQGALESRNSLSREIGAAKKARDEARAESLMAEVARLKELVPELEERERAASQALNTRLAEIPNTPNPEVPEGADEHGNVERGRWGKPTTIAGAREHFDLAESWPGPGGPLMDFEAAAKLSGS